MDPDEEAVEDGFELYEQEGESLLGDVTPTPLDAPPARTPPLDAPPARTPPLDAPPARTPPLDAPPARTPPLDAPPARETRAVPTGPPPPLALYRRYRPDTFADVIGQEHVTQPLSRALVANRVNHAYLFSGPRGCGKTTSARVLARCLNCEQGPTPEPCGTCQSCRDLARGGPGSIDVIEMDAASHGGVDDARDLRERAFFAPVQSRYKIYIIDEAHQVTNAGFNALLKLVEEPPPHVKFIFATTDPDKVIGTIRSRTHHYPFRLVPPKILQAYLGQLCESESIAVEPTVLPLVVRAGGGSVRDSLSVLDQLLGGAAETGVSYAQAVALLGYTPDALLDEVLDAFAAGDAGGVFRCIDRVIEVGQDPKRFGEDLLRRLRDLVIVAAVSDALSSGLVEAAEDQAERLRTQAAAMGPGELTRAAEVIAHGLTEMRGTTAPRLHLELMCARALLPGADVDDRGIHARLDRLERRIGMMGDAAIAAAPTGSPPGETFRPTGVVEEQGHPPNSGPQPKQPGPGQNRGPEQQQPPQQTGQPPHHGPKPAPQAQGSGPAPELSRAPSPAAAPTPGPTGLSAADVRRLWPQVLEEMKSRKRFTWMLVSQNAQVSEVGDGVLHLVLNSVGARERFSRGGNEDILREALVQVLGVDLRVETHVEGEPISAAASGQSGAPGSARAPGSDGPPQGGSSGPDGGSPGFGETRAGGGAQGAGSPAPGTSGPGGARGFGGGARQETERRRPEPEPEPEYDPSEGEVVDSASPGELLTRHLGAELISDDEPRIG